MLNNLQNGITNAIFFTQGFYLSTHVSISWNPKDHKRDSPLNINAKHNNLLK